MMSKVDNTFSFFCDSYRYNANEFLTPTEAAHYPTSKDVWTQYKDWCSENNSKPKTKKEFQEGFKVLVQKYRPDVVISEPFHQEDTRGKIVKFYFPELFPEMEGDYFADSRDEQGRVPGQDGYTDQLGNVQEVEEAKIEEVIDAQSKAEFEAGMSEVIGENVTDRLIARGKKIFDECMAHPTSWWNSCMSDQSEGVMLAAATTDSYWRALTAYIHDKPFAMDAINFRQHFSDYLNLRR